MENVMRWEELSDGVIQKGVKLNPGEGVKPAAARGIVLIANGERDRLRVDFLLRSLQKAGYTGSIVTIADEGKAGFESRWYKTQLDRFSPFEETLFLDADIVAMQSFNEIWDYLSRGELWMARDMHTQLGHALGDKTSRANSDERAETRALCDSAQPFFNSGVILFHKTEAVRTFFDQWHTEWARFRNVDQFAAARSMKTTGFAPSELPRRYNHPLRRYRQAPSPDVTFLHCWGYPRKRYPFLVTPLLECPAPAVAP